MIPEETPAAVPAAETPAEEVQYEYVEVPADQANADGQQYEYVEVPADQAEQYEYVEVPAAAQDTGVEKLDELEEVPSVENVFSADEAAVPAAPDATAVTDDAATVETIDIPETAVPAETDDALEIAAQAAPAAAPAIDAVPAAFDVPSATAASETYDFASLEIPETAETPTVENITPVETIDIPETAASAETDDALEIAAQAAPAAAPAIDAVPAAPSAATLQDMLETPETETQTIDAAALTDADKIYSAEELETPEAAIEESTQEELDPPEISDTLSAPASDTEAAAEQETADMTRQAETAREAAEAEIAEAVENITPAETDDATPAETTDIPETTDVPVEVAAQAAPDAAPAAPAIDAVQPVEEQTSEKVDAVPAAPSAAAGFVFKDGDGQKSFTAESAAQGVTIDTADLSRWMIVLNQISVSSVEAAAGQQIELSPDMYCQGQLIGATGDVMPFANMAAVPVPEFSPDPVQSATLFFSGVSIIPLANQGGVTMDLGGANGVIVNTNGDTLYFANLSALTLIETPAPVKTDATLETAEIDAAPAAPAPDAAPAVPAAPSTTAPAYAFAPVPAPLDDAVVFSADSESAQIDGNDGKPHILVKANGRLLGWHADFANAGRMSLADVKAYQETHGDLPEHDGVLTFKDKSLTFKNIRSIRVFETPAYCGYGVAPTA